MKRRNFITLLGAAVTWPVTGRAQQTVPVVGFVFSGTASNGAPRFDGRAEPEDPPFKTMPLRAGKDRWRTVTPLICVGCRSLISSAVADAIVMPLLGLGPGGMMLALAQPPNP